MHALLTDLRYAARLMRQNWGLTVIAVLSLALGIGANTAIFSLVNAVLLRSLPVKNPEQLVLLTDPASSGTSIGIQTGVRTLLAYPEFERIRDRNKSLAGIFAAESETDQIDIEVGGASQSAAKEQVRTKMVSGGYFNVLGVQPILGRVFSRDEDRAFDARPYAVISYDFWKRRFALDPAVLGTSLKVYRTAFTIIGVAPQGFFGETVGASPDIWFPLTMQHEVFPGRDFLRHKPGAVEKIMWLQVMGRIRPGVSEKQAQAELNGLFQQILAEDAVGTPASQHDIRNQRIEIRRGAAGASSLRSKFSEPLLVLFVVVGLVLLIACANVANLLLARATARQKEIGIRLALGAGRWRLVRQLITESVLLGLLGGALGVLFAWWADALLLVMVSTDTATIPLDVSPDARLLLFTAGVSLVTGVLFGLAPALRATKVDLNPVLKESARGLASTGGRVRGLPLGKLLVSAQVALSIVLLIGAGLFVRSLSNLSSVKLGYDPDRLLLIFLDPTPSGYKGPAVANLYEELLRRIRALPGVRAASLSQNGLFSGSESGDMISVEGYTSKDRRNLNARFDQIAPRYFETVGIPLVAGRDFGPQDSGNAPHVCIINETMAKFYFHDQNPIGRHITDEFPDTRTQFEIVGVVKDAKYNNVREKTPRRFYIPFFNGMGDPNFARLEVRTFADPAAVATMVRKEVQNVDSTLTLGEVHTMGELVNNSLVQDRLIGRLSSFFGVLALLLASIGLYGVMSFAITRRTSEIGLRVALGAGQRAVVWMVLRESLVMVVVGVAIGVPAALAMSRIVESRLYGLAVADPAVIAISAAVLLSVAGVAAIVPAIRAAHVDPVVALRYE